MKSHSFLQCEKPGIVPSLCGLSPPPIRDHASYEKQGRQNSLHRQVCEAVRKIGLHSVGLDVRLPHPQESVESAIHMGVPVWPTLSHLPTILQALLADVHPEWEFPPSISGSDRAPNYF
jgi:hypothetical protein